MGKTSKQKGPKVYSIRYKVYITSAAHWQGTADLATLETSEEVASLSDPLHFWGCSADSNHFYFHITTAHVPCE